MAIIFRVKFRSANLFLTILSKLGFLAYLFVCFEFEEACDSYRGYHMFIAQPILLQGFLAISILATFLNLLGLSILQAGLNDVIDSSPLRLHGYLFFLQLSLVIMIIFAMAKNSLVKYKFAIIAYSAVFLGTFPNLLDVAIETSKNSAGSFRSGGGLMAAGIILFVIPLFVFVGYLSVEDLPRNEMKMVPQPPLIGSFARNIQIDRPPSTQIDNSVQKTTAVALYAYEANPSDPNEVSFPKGQVMEVLDNKGKWWQVTFSHPDGSTVKGIAPSNYLQSQ